MPMPSEQEMLEAITSRDQSRNGDFYYGVITTGIFCQPSCSSRTAKSENIRFFPDIESAMSAGFRPCKRCMGKYGEARITQLINIVRYIDAHANESLTLVNLAALAALSPSRFQRIFKDTFGISPKDYQNAVRMRRFKKALKDGDGVTDAIFSTGFGSISRVYGESSRSMGMTPKAYRAGGKGELIRYACRNTALGLMAMAATDKGVCFVEFGEDEAALVSQLNNEFPNACLIKSAAQHSTELDEWVNALDCHISHGYPRPDLPLDIRGTAFQIKVWQFLMSIKEGEVISYTELALGIDKPKAVRAVASACARNRIGVLIPCHRILRGDGSLGGYRWGLARKSALLEAEKKT